MIVKAVDYARFGDRPAEIGTATAQGLCDILAIKIIQNEKINWNDITIDCRGLRTGELITSFASSFVRRFSRSYPGCLNSLKKIKWLTNYDFQKDNIEGWVRDEVKATPSTAFGSIALRNIWGRMTRLRYDFICSIQRLYR
jgi:hypothetical protein